MLLYSILGGVLLLLLLLLLTPLDVGADILHEAGQQTCKLRFRVLGIPITVKIPLSKEEKKAEKAADTDIKKAEKVIKAVVKNSTKPVTLAELREK